MNKYFSSRWQFCFSIIFLLCAQAIYSEKLELKNGTVFDGTIVTQNENFFVLDINGSRVNVYKQMVVKIDGKPYDVKQNSNAIESNQQLSKTGEENSLAHLVNKDVVITLKNSTTKQGKLLSATDLTITLGIGESKLPISRTVVQSVNELTPGTNQNVNVNKIVSTPKQVPTSNESNGVVIKKNSDSTSKLLNLSTGNEKKSIEPKGSDEPLVSKVNQTESSPNKGIIKVDSSTSKPSSPVQNLSKKDSLINKNPPVQKSEIKVAKDSSQKSTEVSSLPLSKVTSAVPKKKPGGSSEIVLQNGSVLVGVIKSETDRMLSISVDGATMNVLKTLIKSIDGAPVNDLMNSSKTLDSTLTKQSRTKSVSVASTTSKGDEKSLKPHMPKIDVPLGVSPEELADSLGSSNWQTRSNAAYRLSAMGQWANSAIPSLVKLLGDTAFSQSKPPLWFDTITLNKPLIPGYEAARALARMGQKGVFELKQARLSFNVLIRRRSVFGLGEVGDPNVVDALTSSLNDSDIVVRSTAVAGLRFPAASGAIIRMVKDDDPETRVNACLVLGYLKEQRSVKVLIDALYDKRSNVRSAAATALGKIGGAQAVAPLVASLSDGNLFVRENAAMALGETKDTSAVMALIAALKDPSPQVRTASAISLGKVLDPRAIPSLYPLLNDESTEVRSAANESIRLLTDILSLINSLDDQSEMVRDNASYILWLMTGKDFGQDKIQWQNWYTSQTKSQIKNVPSK